MSRFIAIVSLVLAGLAVASAAAPSVAEIEAAVFTTSPNDYDEVIDLRDEHKVFTDFCLQSRDRILTDVGRKRNGLGIQLSKLVDKLSGNEHQALVRNTKGSCKHMEEYEHDLIESFRKTRDALAAQNPTVANLEVWNIKCTTSSRVLRYTGWCRDNQFM